MAVVAYRDGQTEDVTRKAVWSVGNTDVARIDSTTGVLVTVGRGRVTVSASYRGLSGSAVLTIRSNRPSARQ